MTITFTNLCSAQLLFVFKLIATFALDRVRGELLHIITSSLYADIFKKLYFKSPASYIVVQDKLSYTVLPVKLSDFKDILFFACFLKKHEVIYLVLLPLRCRLIRW